MAIVAYYSSLNGEGTRETHEEWDLLLDALWCHRALWLVSTASCYDVSAGASCQTVEEARWLEERQKLEERGWNWTHLRAAALALHKGPMCKRRKKKSIWKIHSDLKVEDITYPESPIRPKQVRNAFGNVQDLHVYIITFHQFWMCTHVMFMCLHADNLGTVLCVIS